MSSLQQIQRRTVFKPLLDNPYTDSKFPHIPPEKQQEILDFLMHFLNDIKTFNDLRPTFIITGRDTIIPKPEITNYIQTGFNTIMKELEFRAKYYYSPRFTYLFVCNKDIKPSLLISHLPNLAYFLQEKQHFKLIQLPRDSMDKLTEILKVKSGLLLLEKNRFMSTEFIKLLDQVENVKVDWLEGFHFKYKKTKVKMLRTTDVIIPKSLTQKKKNNQQYKVTK